MRYDSRLALARNGAIFTRSLPPFSAASEQVEYVREATFSPCQVLSCSVEITVLVYSYKDCAVLYLLLALCDGG